MKKKTIYTNEKTIYNGTTTIVYGSLITRPRGVIDSTGVEAMKSIIKVSETQRIGKGIAKLNPIDKYDEKKGIMVASNKAEAIVNKGLIRDLKNSIAACQEYCAACNGLIEDLERRNDVIKSREN